jgi:hypothetical protein
MFQIVEPKSYQIIFEGEIPELMRFAVENKMSAHIYFDESKYLGFNKGELSQMVGILDAGKAYWLSFNPTAKVASA